MNLKTNCKDRNANSKYKTYTECRVGDGASATRPAERYITCVCVCVCGLAAANQGEGEAADPAGGQPGGERPRPRVGAEALGQHGGPQVPRLLTAHGQIQGEPGEEPGGQL